MNILIKYCIGGFSLMLASASYADWNGGVRHNFDHYRDGSYNWVDKRQNIQDRRIDKGVQSGRLTAREAYQLNKQQKKIARLENRFERDGHLSRYEKFVLAKKLNNASRRIFLKKNNMRYDWRQNAYNGKWGWNEGHYHPHHHGRHR